jgi:ring-1,2-phenylacetyl-CoA epoxidase subunit PaaC
MTTFATAKDVPADLQPPLSNLLLSLADDEFILGYWDSEWTGVAPTLEEDVACSSIAQDEIGHARLFYQEVSALTGTPIDQLAYGRKLPDYRQAQLVERNRGDWAFTIARQFLYETADLLRMESLIASSYQPIAQAVAKIRREEVYHQMHVHTWFIRLAQGTPDARQRLGQALESLWPDALGLFEPFPNEDTLLQYDILATSNAQLQQAWLASIAPDFERLQLAFPASLCSDSHAPDGHYLLSIKPRLGGRYGRHTQDFRVLWEQMTMVYRLDPQASW